MTKNKDWKGNSKSTFVTLGASNHTEKEREEHDYYSTDPRAGEMLLDLMPELDNIYECAVGQGHLAKVFEKHGKLGCVSDLIDRGYIPEKAKYFYGDKANILEMDTIQHRWSGDIVSNPPYKYAREFCEKALELVNDGRYVCMFLKIQFLEGKARREFFKKYPPKYVCVSSSRIDCAMNGDFENYKGGALCYCWFIWQKGFTGDTIIRWFN